MLQNIWWSVVPQAPSMFLLIKRSTQLSRLNYHQKKKLTVYPTSYINRYYQDQTENSDIRLHANAIIDYSNEKSWYFILFCEAYLREKQAKRYQEKKRWFDLSQESNEFHATIVLKEQRDAHFSTNSYHQNDRWKKMWPHIIDNPIFTGLTKLYLS